MPKVILHILDARKVNMDDLGISNYLQERDFIELNKYLNKEKRTEKNLSLYLKKKYVGQFYLDEHNQPQSDKFYFNIAHSLGVVILGISEDAPIGVDIEVRRKVEDKILKYVGNQEEIEYVKEPLNFFEIWTNKESLRKCQGIGIDKDLNQVPALPIEGKRIYQDEIYQTKNLKIDDYVISITTKTEESSDLSIIYE